MILPASPLLRRRVAALCVGLALVFLGASTVNQINQVEHLNEPAHSHGQDVDFVVAAFDHHDDGGDDRLPASDNDAGDRGQHHHADTPPASTVALDLLAETRASATLRMCAGPDQGPPSFRARGPERPPRRIAIA